MKRQRRAAKIAPGVASRIRVRPSRQPETGLAAGRMTVCCRCCNPVSARVRLSPIRRPRRGPEGSTRDELLKSLSATLVALVGGTWDNLDLQGGENLPVAQEEHVGSRQIARTLFGLMRTALAALLPRLMFLTATKLNLTGDLSDETRGLVEVGAFTWSAFVVMFLEHGTCFRARHRLRCPARRGHVVAVRLPGAEAHRLVRRTAGTGSREPVSSTISVFYKRLHP
jgi:hypothetical protein